MKFIQFRLLQRQVTITNKRGKSIVAGPSLNLNKVSLPNKVKVIQREVEKGVLLRDELRKDDHGLEEAIASE